MEKSGNHLKEVIQRLNILILLNLELIGDKGSMSMADKIRKLASYGMSAGDISKILGKQTNYITASLSQKKTKKKE